MYNVPASAIPGINSEFVISVTLLVEVGVGEDTGSPVALAEAEQAIFEYIELFYNRVRFRSTIGYIPPLKKGIVS